LKFFSTIIEQLDMALAEIAVDQPINSRLALILIDNATELLIHRSCEQYAARGAGKDKTPLSPKMRREATGDHFEPKLAVMRHVDAITEDERRFIAIAHAYRNELYHVGLRHEEVLRPIAQHYFQLACAFLPKMGPRSIGWGPDFKLSERVRRYVPDGGGPGSMAFHHREPIAAALLEALPRSRVSLGMSLKTDLMHRIGRIEKHFIHISRGLDGKATPAATLENLQFSYDHNALLRKKSDESIWIPWDAPFMQGHKRRLMATGKRRYSTVPIAKWRQKASLIGKETNWLRAAAAHDDLNRQMDYLDDAIIEALSEFDGWVQQQIDRARGK
jgi:hypothetical protein